MNRSSIIVLSLSALFAVTVIWTARRRRTAERHTFAWLAVAASVASLAIWRHGIEAIAQAMGIYYAPSALFFTVCGGLTWLVYRQSLDLSEQRRRITRLAQEVTVLSAQLAQQDLQDETRSQEGVREGANQRAIG